MDGRAVRIVTALFVFASSSLVEPSPLKRSLEADAVRSEREAFVPCFNNPACYPDDLKDSMVPTEYIKCESYNCICNSNCFKLNGSVCDYSVCGQYDNITSTCTDSPDLKDQKTAFLLSMFLSSVGAANFYIERYDLAIPQLVMSVVMVATPIVLLSICCCALACGDNSGHMGGIGVQFTLMVMFFVAIVPIIIAVILALITIAWWIADLVVFVNNERTDGNGCPLTASL